MSLPMMYRPESMSLVEPFDNRENSEGKKQNKTKDWNKLEFKKMLGKMTNSFICVIDLTRLHLQGKTYYMFFYSIGRLRFKIFAWSP